MTRRNRSGWIVSGIAGAALLVGVAVGYTAGHSDPIDSPEYREQAELAADSRDELRDARRQTRAAEEDAERAIAEAESALAAREAELDQRAADLDARDQAAPAPAPAPAPGPSPSPSPTAPAPAAPRAESNLTPGQQNARGAAQNYLSFSSFSRSGLIEQLEYEGYSNADATWAVDGLGTNWNEQAAKSAQNYLSFSSFSRSGLIEQLEYEGFTREQAEYGVTAAGY